MRGARAIHGEQCRDGLHSHSPRTDGTLVMADRAWLVVTCWCESTYIGVPQRDVHYGRTRSCGRDWCTGPDGSRIMGNLTSASCCKVYVSKCHDRAVFRSVDQTDRSQMAPAYQPERHLPDPKLTLHRQLVAGRRDVVAGLWEKIGSYQAVADRLGLTYQTVANDVYYLRSKGRL